MPSLPPLRVLLLVLTALAATALLAAGCGEKDESTSPDGNDTGESSSP